MGARVPELVDRLGEVSQLDVVAKPLAAVGALLTRQPVVRKVLSGSYLGHAVHPVLTDVPIGAWTMAAVLDTAGGPGSASAADILVGAGIAAALPTAATGVNDWFDTFGTDRRVGVVHALANYTALGLYVASLVNRRRGRRGRGKLLAAAGFAALNVGGYLGGHLAFARGVNVNHVAFTPSIDDWTPALPDAELPADGHRVVDAGGVAVLLTRLDGAIYALTDTCSHAGGPLHEGTFADGCVTCPWHGSTFRLDDGSIVRAPASHPALTFETRVRDGQIEIRSPR